MKRNFFKLSALLLGLCASVGFFGNKDIETAKAAGGDEKWGLVGSFAPSGWADGQDIPFTWNSATSRYELTYTLNAGDQFKMRTNGKWGVEIGWGRNTGGGISTYLSNSGGNFKVKTTNTYLLKIEDNVTTWGDKSYGFSIETATVEKHTITYYNGATVIKTVEAPDDGNKYYAEFVYQEGYRLEGWYTDAALTQPYNPAALTADLSLYGKYVAAENFGLYMKNTPKWSKVNVYLWNGTANVNNNWPGVAMTAVEGTDYYYTEIDGAYGYDHIIFNDSSAQTVDLDLADKTVCYVLGEKDANGHYTATAAEVRKVIAYVPGDVYAYEDLGYTGDTATGTGFATISFDKGAVTVKENDPSITASEKEAALIERIAKVDTCTEYAKHAVYRNLVTVSGIEGALSLTVTDAGGDVTIGDKLAYMEYLDGYHAEAAATTSTHTILAGQSSSLWFVILIGVLGLGSVLGYYFLSKKRFSK